MATVSLKNISKEYANKIAAVKNLSIEVQDREFLILVGPSGCGKSTTLRMIAGLEKISEGELCIDGCRMNEVEPKNRNIAMVFQNYALYPHMNVYENMAFGLKVKKLPREEIDRKVREAAEILGLTELLFRKPRALSGGQRQRVAMGRAIVRRPKVFLMDEPLSNLDARLRTQMRVELARLHRELGATILYVTHDQTEAMTLGTRIAVMQDGVLQQIDTPKRVYESPANLFVAEFIGAPQMNTASAGVMEENGTVLIELGGIRFFPGTRRAALLRDEGYVGKSIVIGIRPESVHLLQDEKAQKETEKLCTAAVPEQHGAIGPSVNEKEQLQIAAELRSSELLGAESYLYFDFAGAAWTARADADAELSPGANVRFLLDLNKLHAFDAETGKAIFH